MKWTTATALFLAISAGGVGAAVVLNRQPKSPTEILAEVRAEIPKVTFDKRSGLERLERALDDARAISDPNVAAELLETRADLYRELGAYDRAREDLEQLLATHRRGDRILELEIARLQQLDGRAVEALQRVRGILQREPDFTQAWKLRGELEEAVGEQQLTLAQITVNRSLAQIDARDAMEIVRELTARDVEDPARDFLTKQLRDLFAGASGTDLNDVLRFTSEPRSSFKRAREAYAQTMAVEDPTESIIALSQSLERAGRRDLSIQLQRAARNLDAVLRSPEAVSVYLDDLAEAQRLHEARNTVLDWDWEDGGSLEFFRSAGTVLYKAQEYKPLNQVSIGLTKLGADTGLVWGRFFKAVLFISNARGAKDQSKVVANMGNATNWLGAFIRDEDHAEPFFGAKTDAEFWRAEAYRLIGSRQQERHFLRQALRLRPDHSPEAWVRLAELLRESKGEVPWREVEAALSKAMDIAPEKTASLAPLWYDAGERAIAKKGLTLDQIIDGVARSGGQIPAHEVGPSILTQLAKSHLENGNAYAAIRAAKEARAEYRNLVPPLDVIIEAELTDTRLYSPERSIIQRIEAAGIDENIEKLMTRLPAGRLEGKALVRAIFAAPRRFGKAAVARHFVDLDDESSAGDALVGIDDETAPPALRFLRARLMIEAERWQDAIREIGRLERADQVSAGSLLLRIEALIGMRNLRALEPTVDQFLSTVRPTSPHVLTAVDLLASAGRADLARKLLDQSDQYLGARNVPFYRRRVLVDVLAQNEIGEAAAHESILRAEAYLEDGTPELAAILLAVGQRDWTELPGLVKRLQDSDFKPTKTQEAALALLGERLESASRAISTALERNPRSADWAFLAAASASLVDDDLTLPPWFGSEAADDAARLLRGSDARSVKDPRDALALYLVSHYSRWSAWVLPRLGELRAETESTLWTTWLESRVAEARDEPLRLGRAIESMLRVSPRFGPAHDLAIALAKVDHPTEPLHPELVRARRRRLESMGEELIRDPIEVALAQASEFARRGEYREGAQVLAPVLNEGGPYETEGRLMLGILTLRAGQPSLAAQQLAKASKGDTGVFEDVVIDSMLFAIDHALETAKDATPQRGELTRERALELLDDLALDYPLDPMVALAQLKHLDVGEGERGARATGVVRRLWDESGGQTLDGLRRGAARKWIEFLAPIAPDVAAFVIKRDLEAEPGNLDLWQLGGEVAQIQGDSVEARRYFETLMEIDARPETGYALVELMIQDGAEPAEVRPILRQASRAQAGGSSRAVYLETVSELRSRRPKLDRIIKRLDGLWSSRERSRREVDPLDLGLLYVDALFRRSTDEDLRTIARVLNQMEPLADESLYGGVTVEALRGLRLAIVKERKRKTKVAKTGPTGDEPKVAAQPR